MCVCRCLDILGTEMVVEEVEMPMAGEVELAPAGTLPPSIQRASSVVVDSGFDFLRFS